MRVWLLLALALSGSSAAQDFPVPVAPVFPLADAFTLADLDGDGRADVITTLDGALISDPDVAVTLSLPGGQWAEPVTYATGKIASGVAAGLIDADGLPDVAVCHQGSQTVVVLPGAGGGALGPAATYFVGGTLHDLELGDLGGDGAPDLVTFSTSGSGEVRVNHSNGTGGYLATTGFAAGGTGTRMQLGDLDGDGALDVGVAHATQHLLATLLNDGAGGLAPPVLLATPGSGAPNDLALADLTGDGWLDVLVSHTFAPGLALYAGDGAGGGGLLPPTGLDAGSQVLGAAVADLDGDALPDIVTGDAQGFSTTFAPGAVAVLRGLGGGAFSPPAKYHADYAPGLPAVADLSGDGVPDIATHGTSGNLAYLRGDGAGGFESLRLVGVELPNSVEAADFDGDALPDLLVAGGSSHVVNLLLADGAGGWLEPQAVPAQGQPVDAEPGDFDGDGALDALVGTSPTLALFRGDGQGALLPPTVTTVPGVSVGQLEPCDLDGDGDLDALAAAFLGSSLPSQLQALLGDGLGGFLPGASVVVGKGATDVAVGDLDGDGAPDGATSNLDSGTLSIALNDGLGGLLPSTSLATGPAPRGVVFTDLNGDGALDAAVAHYGFGGIVRLLGDGAGGLGAPQAYPPGKSAAGLAAGDLDGDGAPDIVATGYDLPVGVWRGDGAGGLLPPLLFQSATDPARVAIADVNGDARPEVLVACSQNISTRGCITVLTNLTQPFVWADLGFALAGALGEPELTGSGDLVLGTPGSLVLHHARALSLAVLFIGLEALPLPFKGGTLVPLPPVAQIAVVTDAFGAVSVEWQAWPSNAPGEDWYFQYGIADPAAVHGVALSNALRGEEP